MSACPDDTALLDGISDSCVLDATAWADTTEHTLHVTAELDDASEVSWDFRY